MNKPAFLLAGASLLATFSYLRAQNAPLPSAQNAPSPPSQAANGPGGSLAAHGGVLAHRYGQGADEYWVFEPDKPAPNRAPVVAFMHGWGATDPRSYGAWIDHIVRRGRIVIYPRYQADLQTPSAEFTPNALGALVEALRRLQSETGHVRPDLTRFAVVGHSAGGLLAANVGALALAQGLPRPRAVMCVEPGRTWSRAQRGAVALADLKTLPADALLLTVVGDRDQVVKDFDAKRIFAESTSLAPQNKNYVILRSDEHGQPPLIADHFAPSAPGDVPFLADSRDNRPLARRAVGALGAVNALDFYGTWKLFDGLCDAAFDGTNRQYALGDTPQQRFMGAWSDGTPVAPLSVSANP